MVWMMLLFVLRLLVMLRLVNLSMMMVLGKLRLGRWMVVGMTLWLMGVVVSRLMSVVAG